MIKWATNKEVQSFGEIIADMEKFIGEKLDTYKNWEYPLVVDLMRKHNITKGKILDFGAGISPFGAYLSSLGYDVTCYDIPSGWHKEVGEAEYNKMYNCAVKYIKDCSQLGEFDVIFSASTIEHVSDRKGEMVNLLKHLKNGGLLIHIVDYPYHQERINIKELADCIRISYEPKITPGCAEFIGMENMREELFMPWPGFSRVAIYDIVASQEKSTAIPIPVLKNKQIIEAIPEGTETIIEAGAGKRELADYLAGYYKVRAIDIDTSGGSEYGDLTNWDSLPVKEADVVICSQVLEHIEDWKTAYKNLMKLARKKVIITIPYQRSYFDPGHINFWDEQNISEFSDLADSKYKISIRRTITKPEDTGRQWIYLIEISK